MADLGRNLKSEFIFGESSAEVGAESKRERAVSLYSNPHVSRFSGGAPVALPQATQSPLAHNRVVLGAPSIAWIVYLAGEALFRWPTLFILGEHPRGWSSKLHHSPLSDRQRNAAVAIRLRSTYTGVDDYILEFFLPPNINENKEQQLLLDSLSGTIQRVCKSLRTVSDAELVDSIDPKDDPCGVSQSLFTNDRPLTQDGSNGSRQSLDRPMIVNDCIKEDGYFEQVLCFKCFLPNF